MTPLPPPQRWKFATAGLELVGILGLLAAAGHWLDGRMSWGPWGLLAGCFLGIVGGLYRLIRQVRGGERAKQARGE